MLSSVTELFEEACLLGEGDRAALAGLLLESLDQPPSPGSNSHFGDYPLK